MGYLARHILGIVVSASLVCSLAQCETALHADIGETIGKLEHTKQDWERERAQISRRLDAVTERLDKLNDRPAERAKLAKDTESHLKESQKIGLKALPGAFNEAKSLDTVKALLGMTKEMIVAEQTQNGRLLELDIAEIDGTTEQTKAKVQREVTDLKAAVAIYSFLIGGLNTKIGTLKAQAIEAQKARLNGLLKQLVDASNQAKQQREARLEKERREAEKQRQSGAGHGDSRPERPGKPSGSPESTKPATSEKPKPESKPERPSQPDVPIGPPR
jgi:peptidoglycan hydrolase CwlO-like protein